MLRYCIVSSRSDKPSVHFRRCQFGLSGAVRFKDQASSPFTRLRMHGPVFTLATCLRPDAGPCPP